jgi:hypothetical protein
MAIVELPMSAVLLWHRRHAMQLAMQMPESQKDALLIAEALKDLVRGWLPDDAKQRSKTAPTDDHLLDDRPLEDRALREEGAAVLAFVAPVPGGKL